MMSRATIDFETRSACSLRKCGSWRYSLDSSTSILCLAYRLPYWVPGRTGLWHPPFPHLDIHDTSNYDDLSELIDWIDQYELIEAHNAWFERGIWTNILVPTYGFPLIRHDQWRCSAAKAASHALPRSLEGAIDALGLKVHKDLAGQKVMKKVAKPRKARKKELELWVKAHGDAPMPILYHESKDLFEQLWAYCPQDVLAEEGLSHAIPDLNWQETDLYLLDQQMNERGFQLDREAVQVATQLIERESVILNKELAVVTKGKVKKATQRAQMLEWFESKGLLLEDTQGQTLDDALKSRVMNAEVRRGLELVRNLGRSSTAKYAAMANWICPDDRVHGGLLYHGAGTGRWSGSGVQPHNFVKGTVKDIEALWATLKTLDRDQIAAQYTSVMDALANALRGAITAAPGKQLYVADYASIEARVLLWAAGDEEALGIFERHEDIYCSMASDIYDRVITKKDTNERQLGKAAVLGCGYQMGAAKFVSTAAIYGVTIDDDFAQHTVAAYRERFWRVKQMWYDQEDAAIRAVRNKRPVECGVVTWIYEAPFLYCELPSGRRLAYPYPEVRERETPWGASKPSLTYKGVNPFNRQWQRQTTYGGSLVENIVQAIARDIMAEAMLRCEMSGTYSPILSVHDELIAESRIGEGSVKEFEGLLIQRPTWAPGCPIEAEGWAGTRYRK